MIKLMDTYILLTRCGKKRVGLIIGIEDKSGRVEFTIAIQPLVENALSSARVPATVVWIGPGVKDLAVVPQREWVKSARLQD